MHTNSRPNLQAVAKYPKSGPIEDRGEGISPAHYWVWTQDFYKTQDPRRGYTSEPSPQGHPSFIFHLLNWVHAQHWFTYIH
jgi:hypothetical protein